MTEATNLKATRRSRSRIVRNPGAKARTEVQTSLADAGSTGEAPSVTVRCGVCNKRQYDVVVGQVFSYVELQTVADGTLIVKRKCPSCRGLNERRVTASDGKPLKSSDALNGPWPCIQCDWLLAKIDAIRGRVTTRCQCDEEIRVIAAQAIEVLYRPN
jgi:hypothetical protein